MGLISLLIVLATLVFIAAYAIAVPSAWVLHKLNFWNASKLKLVAFSAPNLLAQGALIALALGYLPASELFNSTEALSVASAGVGVLFVFLIANTSIDSKLRMKAFSTLISKSSEVSERISVITWSCTAALAMALALYSTYLLIQSLALSQGG